MLKTLTFLGQSDFNNPSSSPPSNPQNGPNPTIFASEQKRNTLLKEEVLGIGLDDFWKIDAKFNSSKPDRPFG
jgi:hypothetical protein